MRSSSCVGAGVRRGWVVRSARRGPRGRARRRRCRRGRRTSSWLVMLVASVVTGLSSRADGDGGRGGDHVAGPDRREEPPRHLEEDAPGSGQLLGDERVEQSGGHAALDDDAAEAGARGEVVVVVDRVAVPGDLGEELDVATGDGPGASGDGADLRCWSWRRGWPANLPPACLGFLPAAGDGPRKGAGRTCGPTSDHQPDTDPGDHSCTTPDRRPRQLPRAGAAHRRTPARPADGPRARARPAARAPPHDEA